MLFECSPRSQLVFSTILEYRFSAVIVGFKSEDIVRMFARGVSASLLFLSFITCTQFLFAGDTIPKAAWKRGIGQPLENAGGRKPALGAGMIDDGYWQGAPVGGFGAGTFSRTYRGDFSRWHIKSGAHKYQTVWSNQLAMFQQQEGGERRAGTYRCASRRTAVFVEMGLSGRCGRLLLALPEVLVRLSLGQISGACNSRAVLSGSPKQLSREQLSGRRLSLARGKSH